MSENGHLPAQLVDLSTIDPPVALTPLDGRYRKATAALIDYLSEPALNRARLHVEIEWLIYLTDNRVLPGAPQLSKAEKHYLRELVKSFSASAIEGIAQIEADTLHDVKAVEYFLKEAMAAAAQTLGETTVLPKAKEIVHIFCTSEDINNLAYALLIRGAIEKVWLPAARKLADQLAELAREYAEVPILAHTHGQPATPVTFGHQIAVWTHRLRRQLTRIETQEYLGKIAGATSNWAAHTVAVPDANWQEIACGFTEHLGLAYNPLTTQIESHDWQAELYTAITHFGRVAHNIATDTWTYISLGYFHQKLSAQGSTGSSTMPHKVNPIRFENAEANLEISAAMLSTLAETLVTSRLQRDLTDSTTQRNIGVGLGHSLLAIDNLCRGFAGLEVDGERTAADLANNWEVLGEAIQQAMRAAAIAGEAGLDDPYERLKELTRGRKVTGADMRDFISSLRLSPALEERLLALTPATYIGLSAHLVSYLD